MSTHAVVAKDLALRGSRGPVYGPLSLEVPTGSVFALTGPAGSGRTSLLLTLTARFRPSQGSLTILGEVMPRHRRQVQRHTAIAGFSGLDEVDDALHVGELITERLDLVTPLFRRAPGLDSDVARDTWATVMGQAEIPARARIDELTPLEELQLRIVLALLGRPALLAVDDVDRLRDPDHRDALWASLSRIADSGTTVITSTTMDPPPAVISLPVSSHLQEVAS